MNISCKIFNNCFHKICIKLSETYFVLISCYKYNPGYQSCFGKNIPLSNNLSEVTNFRSSHHRCFTKKLFLKILIYSQEKTCAGVFFNKVIVLQASIVTKKRLQHRCFFVIIAKFLRTPILKNIYK